MNGALEGLVDKKIRSILSVFIKNKGELFHLQKIAKLSNVPLASSFRIVRRLVSLGFVTLIKINKFKVYELSDSKKTKVLTGFWKNG